MVRLRLSARRSSELADETRARRACFEVGLQLEVGQDCKVIGTAAHTSLTREPGNVAKLINGAFAGRELAQHVADVAERALEADHRVAGLE